MDRWWEAESDALVLGVFQGGGAKGVAYGGALRAVADHGIWFSQVAGASAGAITAAMIAAGVKPKELDGLTADAMASVKRQLVGLVVGRESLLNSRRLGDWLDAELRTRVRGEGDRSGDGVTFAELEETSGIGCHVVALDLATGTPIVFSGALTPDASVVEAVLASSAIPGALNAGRAVVTSGDTVCTHQLIDGGAWANFPTFVFRDAGFRKWAFSRLEAAHESTDTAAAQNLASDTTSMPLIGFVLDSPPSAPITVSELRPRHWRHYPEADLGTGRSSSSLMSFLVSMALGPKEARFALIIAIGVLLYYGFGYLPEMLVDVNEFSVRHLDGWGGALLGGGGSLILLITSFGILAGTFTAVLFGRALAYSALPSARALMGVATRVPPWAHEMPDAIVLHMRSLGLKTLSFQAKKAVRTRVVDGAHHDAWLQLRGRRTSLQEWGVRAHRFDENQVPRAPGVSQPPMDWLNRLFATNAVLRMAGLVVALVFLGWSVSFVVVSILAGYEFGWIFFGACLIVYVRMVLGLLSKRAQRRARGVPALRLAPRLVLALVIGLCAGGSLATALAAPNRQLLEVTVDGIARSERSDTDSFAWTAIGETGTTGRSTSDLPLRVGEQLILERTSDTGGWGVATPGSSPFETLFFPLGFGLAAIGLIYFLADEIHYGRFRRTLGLS